MDERIGQNIWDVVRTIEQTDIKSASRSDLEWLVLYTYEVLTNLFEE